MKSPRYSNWINLMLLIIFVSNLVACTTSLPPPPPIPLPIPDPLDVSGDDLYAIYRKGLITRHIASNGRLLETLALTNIDPELYDNSGYFQFTFSDDSTVPIPIENLRYSWEYTLNESPNHKPILWSPVIAPIKNPGYSNDGYYGVSGQGDNPGYYGGMAVATFSLEAMYGVSPYSLGYARRMIRYFIDSEMWPKNGYILRQSRFYNSNENLNGEPIIRGASAEELLGIMLGIMFYLEAEEKVGNTDLPVYKEVIVLRDKILSRVDGYPKVCVQGYPADPRNYEHKFMLSTDEASFDVSHFAFPLFASKGIVLRDVGGIPCGPVNDFFKLLTGTAGRSATIVNIFGDVFDAYLMYLMSIVLILEGLPDDGSIDKQALARVFMKDFIKAANTSGPDVDNINNNAFWSVVALLVNKYLDPNGNPFDNNPHLEAIWGDEWRAWLRVKEAHTIVANPSSGTMSSGELSSLWQHNLPLMNVAGATTGWSNHNPFHRIGRWFVWKGRFPYYWEQSEWQRERGFLVL